MAKGGRRHTHKKRHTADHVQTIPELRRAFEYIESVGHKLCHTSMKEAIPEFQEEWKKTFHRELDRKSAEAYLIFLKSKKKSSRRKTRRYRGGMGPLAGAPLDYTTRPGIYLQPAGVNQNSYALVPKYVDSGFWNPEQAHQYDPVPGQTHYVTRTPAGMGTNTWPSAFGTKGGSRKKQRGGLASLDQAFMRPFPATVPPSVGQDADSAVRGQQLGQSPDPTQTRLNYLMAPTAQPVPSLNVSPIRVNLMNDIRS